MKQVEIITARLNLNISINRLLFRAKLSDLSEDKVISIQREANDLNQALEVFKMLEEDNRSFERINNSLRLEILYLKKEMIKEQETVEL